MKNLLSLFALCFVTQLHAQKFEAAINSGIGFNTTPSGTGFGNDHATASGATAVGSFRLMLINKKWRYGLDVICMRLSYTRHIDSVYYYLSGHLIELYSGKKVTSVLANPAIPISARVDRGFSIGKLNCYGGLSVGYILIKNAHIALDAYVVNASSVAYDPAYYAPSGSGLSAGLQTGVSYRVFKNIGINGEISAKYNEIFLAAATYKLLAFHAVAGLYYRF